MAPDQTPADQTPPAQASPISVINGPAPTLVAEDRGMKHYVADGEVVIGGLHFPERIARFERGRITAYGTADLGYSVGYNDPEGAFLTLYIYGDGRDAAAEMERVKAEIIASYERVEVLMEGPIAAKFKTADGLEHTISVRSLHLLIAHEGVEFISDSLLLSTGGQYLKERLSYPTGHSDTVVLPIGDLLATLEIVP